MACIAMHYVSLQNTPPELKRHITLDYRHIITMVHRKSGFSVVAFERGQARSRQLAEYLTIYVQNFAPAYRTKTNELLEFLDNPDEGRIVVYYGLSYRGKPCGFATLMHYPDANVAIVDHMAIAPTSRGFGAFFSFSDLIAEYLERKSLEINYLVAEITLGKEPLTTGVTPLALIRLMRFLGFKLVNLTYYTPAPLIVTDKEACRAALMVVPLPEKDVMRADELISLLRLIYLKHNGDWYRRVMAKSKFAEYMSAIQTALERMEAEARSLKLVKVNGMKYFDLPYAIEPSRKISISLLGYMTIIALPASLTIALAVVQELKLTVAVGGFTALLLGATLIPRCRQFLFTFFQLEQ